MAALLRRIALLALLTAAAFAAEPRPIRVLFLGHESEHHNSAKYLPWLMERLGREAIYFDYFTSPDCLTAKTLAHYDAVMLYANHGKIAPEQFAALNDFVERGHGFLPIHCASACFGNEPRFAALVGGRFKAHGTGTFKARFLMPGHPILAGVKEFETWDESYVHDQFNEAGRTLLAERVEGARREPWTWIRDHGKGRVFYTASGHDERTWQNADFQQLLRNAIVWTVGDQVRTEWERFLASREPERREKNPNVANYEKRPEPITFQFPYTPRGAMERTQVPADCRLELFASEPDIVKPIAFAWDERGRLWVAETRDYPHGIVESGEGNDDIKICEDTDGDGRADKFTVFADKLNIPTGIVFARGGVIVSQPPRFVFLKDSNGDDKADIREVIIDAWGVRDTHAQASNLHYGYDNWLYGCVGYSGFEREIGGKRQQFAMGTYRFRPDGSAIEFLHQFSNNSWAHSANDAGDQFGGTANGAPLFFGGIPKTAVPDGVNILTAKKINLVDQAHAITPNYRQVDVFGGYTAAANSNFIYSASLPPRMQGKAMVCEPTMKIVALMDVRPDGAGYVARDAMNLFASSDEWTSPVYAEIGPDGAAWIADWQNFIIQHNPTPSVERGGYRAETGPGGAHVNDLRDHSRGRIYRVVWKDAPPVRKSLAGATTPQLVAALDDDVQHWRLLAQRTLVERRATDAVPALRRLVAAGSGRIDAIHALWALHGLGALDETTHRAALLASDSRLRRNAVRALGTGAADQSLFFGAGVFADRDLATRLAAFVKLATFETTPEIKTLVGRLGAEPAVRRDEWLAEAARLLAKKHGASAFKEGPNLLTNAGLEELGPDGLPLGWKRRDYGGEAKKKGNAGAEWAIVSGTGSAHGGRNALRCITRDDADSSFYQDVALEPHRTYRLSGWVKTHALRGKASFNDHIGRAETERITARESGWVEVEAVFDSGDRRKASINILHVAKGDACFDDLKLAELLPAEPAPERALTGDPARGREIFWSHPVAACKNCHMLQGQGSTVGPALDGIAAKKDAAYLIQSLLEPNARLAEGFEKLGVSPMPPMGLILKPQELEDVKAFVLSLRDAPSR